MSKSSTSSSRKRQPLIPQRDVGRQRVAGLLEAASFVILERGFEATTMAEIAERADARIGSLYRFFPNKEAIGDALMEHYAVVLEAEYAAIREKATTATPQELADTLIDLLVRLHPQMRAAIALLDARTGWTAVRHGFRAQSLSWLTAALFACAPALDEEEADDIAAVLLNNMKTMVGMTLGDAPTTPRAPEELRLMNRLYVTARLADARNAASF